jgi:polyisoprenoid-binding protein YceI
MNSLKHLFMLATLFTLPIVNAQQLEPVNEGSSVAFTIRNLGFDVTGSFSGLKGAILFDEKNLSASSFSVTVNAASIDTDNETRDKHLRGDDYLDVKTYPRISIQSVRVTKSATPGYYVIFAKLTIKETIKDISFPFTVVPEGGAYRFRGEFVIKCRDFAVGGKNTISNELKVKLNVLSKK